MSDKKTDGDDTLSQKSVVINSRRPGNVVINGRTAVHAGSGGVLTTSDVCKTPSKCRPRNYTNVAVSEDAAKTASSVFINGNPACHSQSIFSKSTGDEPGTCGGVTSGTIKQKAEFVTYSNNVFIEGFPAVRQFDLMVSNNRNTPPAPLMQPGAGTPPNLSPENAEGVLLNPESHAVDLDTAGEELGLLKGQYSVLDPNQPTASADNASMQTTTAGQAVSAQPSPSFTPTPRSTLPLPTHVHGGGWTPANQPHYQGTQPDAPSPWQKFAAFSIRAASIITGVLTTDDSHSPLKIWEEGGYQYLHDTPANQLQVYQGQEHLHTYRVEHNDIFTDGSPGTLVLPDTGEVVASVDEEGNVTPVSEQEDIAYRTYQANGGNEGFIAWQSAGRPTQGDSAFLNNKPLPNEKELIARLAGDLRFKMLGTNIEQGGKFSIIEAIGGSRIESFTGRKLKPSDIEGVDFIDQNGLGKIQLKGPFLTDDLSPLTVEQQQKAFDRIVRKLETNTAPDKFIIDTLGLSDEAFSTLQKTLKQSDKFNKVLFLR